MQTICSRKKSGNRRFLADGGRQLYFPRNGTPALRSLMEALLMIWEYERKEIHDKRLNEYMAEKGAEGWEMCYCHRGKQTRVNSDPDLWEVIFKRAKNEEEATVPNAAHQMAEV
jgi:hypothetical protein